MGAGLSSDLLAPSLANLDCAEWTVRRNLRCRCRCWPLPSSKLLDCRWLRQSSLLTPPPPPGETGDTGGGGAGANPVGMGDGPEAEEEVCSSEMDPLPMMTCAKIASSSSSSSSSASLPPPKLPTFLTAGGATTLEATEEPELLKEEDA